jgi:hypothetical protein
MFLVIMIEATQNSNYSYMEEYVVNEHATIL